MDGIKILHISDTHGMHRRLSELPQADILVHSGDFTMNGSGQEALDFLEWLCELPHKHKIFIAGNHDECLYKADINGLNDNVHNLCNSGAEIEGLRFWGVPMFIEDCITERQSEYFHGIPSGTDIIVTHTPPFDILDCDGSFHYGSAELLDRVKQIDPKLHLFGHIHKANGILSDGVTTFSNAAMMDERYDQLQRPHIISV